MIVADQLAERFELPYWRFGNSGTESTLDAVRIMRASSGRKLIVKIEGTYHGHHDSLMVSVFPPQEQAGPRERPASVPQTLGLLPEVVDQTLAVPFNDAAAAESSVRGAPRPDRRHDRRTRHVQLRPGVARSGIPPGAEGSVSPARCLPGVRRGEDRLHARLRRRGRGVRRGPRPHLLGEGDRRGPPVRRHRRNRGSHGDGDPRGAGASRHLQRKPAHDGGRESEL